MSNTQIKLHNFHTGQQHIAQNRGKRTVIRAGRRFGKALCLKTPIPTPDGWKKIGDIAVGDVVFDENGEQCNVIFVTDEMNGRPCNKVVFSDGSQIIADDDHLWETWDKLARKNKRRSGKEIYKPKIVTTLDIKNNLYYRKELNHSIECCKPINCQEKNLLINPYVLGCWLGDGLSDSARFACNDEQIIEEIKKEGQAITKLPQKFMYSFTNGDRHTKHGTSLSYFLNKLGLKNNKHIPADYLRSSYNQRLSLFQGLMDTDGSASTKGHCEYTTIKKELAENVLELALSLGIKATLLIGRSMLNKKDCGEKYRICFSTDIPVFRLKRKLDRLQSRASTKRINHRFIKNVIECKSVPVKCIQVDSESGLYLAGKSFIPTHNTTMLEDIASKFSIDAKQVGWFSPKYKYMQGSFRRLKSNLKPIVERASATDGIIELMTGGIIRFWTLEDEDAGRGDSYDEVIIDEASLVKKGMRDIWEQSISPTLLDRDGNAWMSGTPKGVDADNFFYFACTNKDPSLAQVWKEFHAPTSANPHISEKALAEFKEQLPPLVHQQEVLAEFVDWSGVAFFALQNLLVDGKPVQYPKFCTSILVILDTATKIKKTNDGTGVVFCAFNPLETYHLTILDYDYIQIEGASLELWLPSVINRAEELAIECKARMGVVKRIEDKASGSILLQQCQRNFRKATTQKEAEKWNVQPIPEELVAMGKEGRAIDVSGFVYQGKIKFSEYAYNKVVNFKGITKNHLLSQIIGFRFNNESTDENDDLLDAFTYSCQMAKK